MYGGVAATNSNEMMSRSSCFGADPSEIVCVCICFTDKPEAFETNAAHKLKVGNSISVWMFDMMHNSSKNTSVVFVGY